MSEPTVSVVLPAYNEDEKIAPCLRSIKNQTAPPEEIIVVDHSSEDNTKQIAERYADKVLTAPKSVDLGEVRNIGIREAESEVIYSSDADTIFAPDVIEQTKKAFRENPDLNALAHPVLAKKDDGYVERFVTEIGNKLYREVKDTGWGASMAFRKKVWKEIGGFKNMGGDGYNIDPEDVDFWKRIPDPKRLDNSTHVRAEGSEFKVGLAPVVTATLVPIGVGGYKYNKNWGKATAWGGVGALTGEIGHQLIDSDKFCKSELGKTIPEKLQPHHDEIALAGLGGTFAYDRLSEEGLDDKYKYPAYGFFGGLFLQHLLTEGFSPLFHNNRRSIFDENERR